GFGRGPISPAVRGCGGSWVVQGFADVCSCFDGFECFFGFFALSFFFAELGGFGFQGFLGLRFSGGGLAGGFFGGAGAVAFGLGDVAVFHRRFFLGLGVGGGGFGFSAEVVGDLFLRFQVGAGLFGFGGGFFG